MGQSSNARGLGLGMSKHRAIKFHGYGTKSRKPPRWVVERLRRDEGPRRTEPMFDSLEELFAWQRRTRRGTRR